MLKVRYSSRYAGRSKDLKSFVSINRPENEQTYVEIDILRNNREEVVTVRRTINAETNSSKWLVNGARATETRVKEIMKEESIDVDNLCTFMPQDRVGSFSGMTPKEKFVETLKSIDENLAAKQTELADAESSKENLRRDHDAKSEELKNVQNQLQGMRQEREMLERKEEYKKELLDFEMYKSYLDTVSTKKERNEKQRALELARQRLNEERDKIQPLENRERQLRKKQAEREQASEHASRKQRGLDQVLHRKKEEMEDAIYGVESAAEAISTSERQRIRRELELELLLEGKAKKEAELEQATAAIPNIQRDLEEVKSEIERIMLTRTQINEDIARVKSHAQQLNDELLRIKRELSNLQDNEQCYYAMLQQSNDPVAQDTCRAMQYLMQNREQLYERGALRAKVFGPVAMHCDVADAACAAMVERCVPKNRLLGFIVTNDHDAKALRDIFKGLRVKTDVFTMNNASIDNHRPYSGELLSSIPDLTLKYLAAELKCNDVVRSFLYTFQFLHHALWVRANRLPRDGELERLCTERNNNFRVFVHSVSSNSSIGGIQEYQGKMSRYRAGSLSMSSSAVQQRVFIRAAGSVDNNIAQRRSELCEQEAQLHQQLKEQNDKLTKLNQRLHTAVRGINEWKSKREELFGLLRFSKDIQVQVDSLAKKISNHRSLLAVDADVESSEKMKAYEDAVRIQMEKISETVIAADDCNKCAVQTAVAEGLKKLLGEELYLVKNQLEDARREHINHENAVKKAEREKMECSARAEDVERIFTKRKQEFKERRGLSDDKMFRDVFVELTAEYPTDMVEVENRITRLQALVDSIIDNEGTKARIDELESRLQKLEKDVEEASQKLRDAEGNLRDGVVEWKRKVRGIHVKMNEKFSGFMRKLNLRGELHVKEVGRIDDYEMDIRVSFREEMDMASLSAHTHSGGERSVTTAMYLMALQQMSQSPFRVLDEINQGMDEINERLVLDRIVAECCNENSTAQYFLVTPKLLPALISLDNDGVTILMVQNGPGIRGASFDLERYIRHLERRQSSLGDSSESELAEVSDDGSDDSGAEHARKSKTTGKLPPTSDHPAKRMRHV